MYLGVKNSPSASPLTFPKFSSITVNQCRHSLPWMHSETIQELAEASWCLNANLTAPNVMAWGWNIFRLLDGSRI
jgi:hypothetical protein